MTTPLYPTFKKRVKDSIDQLIRKQVTPWLFLTAGPPLRIMRFDGREIYYQGVRFEGSPRLVFWSGYIGPFLENICVSEIEAAVSLAREKRVDGKLVLRELQGLLSSGCDRVYGQMANVDRRLRGRGNPRSVKLRPVGEECQAMDRFIKERVRAEIEMWTSPSRMDEWPWRNRWWAKVIRGIRKLYAPIRALRDLFGCLV